MVGLGCCLFTDNRVRLGDMVAGTVLVLEEGDASKSLARLSEAMQKSALPLEALRLVQDVLDRWPELEEEQRTRLARGLLAKLDPGISIEAQAVLSGDVLRARLETLLGTRSAS
jgi:hypothetical protein